MRPQAVTPQAARPQAVVFDIGNVLIHWDPIPVYDDLIGADRRKALFAAVDLFAMNRRVDMGENFAEMVEATARENPGWHDEILMWRDNWMSMATPVIDHSLRLMKALQARGVPVFSLSNFGVETYDLAGTHYPFFRDFDRDFISGHLRMMKPDPAIYANVEEVSGIPAGGLIFTDDLRDNIDAAAARGWQTHLFDGPQGWADRLVAAGLLSTEEAR